MTLSTPPNPESKPAGTQQFCCASCCAPDGQPHLPGCPEGDLRIAMQTAIGMLEQLDLSKPPLAIAASVGVLRAALQGEAGGRDGTVVIERLFTSDEIAALRRFDETCQDGEGYDVPWTMMQRLAEIGAVRRLNVTRRFQFTEFGTAVIANCRPGA
jgi:hypothetical protein